MNKQYIDRYLVIDRYLAGDLAENEVVNFEERLVWDQELIEELDLAESLRDGLRATRDETSSKHTATVASSRSVAMSSRLAIAASFAVGMLMTSVFFNQTTSIVSDSNIPTAVIPLDLLRGSNEQEIVVSPDGMMVLMVAAKGGGASYRVVISNRDGAEIIWAQNGLTPGYTDSLAIGLHSALLLPGNYILSVYDSADDTASPIREIPFQTVLAN